MSYAEVAASGPQQSPEEVCPLPVCGYGRRANFHRRMYIDRLASIPCRL